MHELQRHAVRAQHGGELPLAGLEHVEAAIQARAVGFPGGVALAPFLNMR